MKHKTKFDAKDLKRIEAMSAVRLPNDMIAAIMGISKVTFERMMKTDDKLRESVEQGRANFSGKIRNTLARMATVPGKDQFQALKFWCASQEGFRTVDRVELTGADGAPVEIKEMTKKDRLAAIKALDKKLKLTEDE